MVNFYHRFLPDVARCFSPLTEATKTKSQKLTWTDECQTAFCKCKARSALASAVMLHHPDSYAESETTGYKPFW